MVITVRFFASYADKLGIRDTTLTLAEPASVTDVVSSVADLPGGDALPRNPLIAVNHVYASLDTPVSAGDEVAFIPPVAGG
ncbi:MAG TPA: MoaD/ThiS family protein [Gemmatimonadaceae bacterium]|nr:MoaD/ThiS family protein [Gemmatimonadaceae bacterium]